MPSEFVDILSTLNAVDHVDDVAQMCGELVRIVKPGGVFIGSFTLLESPSCTEPQYLTEAAIWKALLHCLEVVSYRLNRKVPNTDFYAPFLNGSNSYAGGAGVLWVRARKTRTTSR